MPQPNPTSSTLTNPIQGSAFGSGPPTRSNNTGDDATDFVMPPGLDVPLNHGNLSCLMPRCKHTRCIVMGKGRTWYMDTNVAQVLLACHKPQQNNNVGPIPNSLGRVDFAPFASLSSVISMPCDALLRYQGLLPTWLHHMLDPLLVNSSPVNLPS